MLFLACVKPVHVANRAGCNSYGLNSAVPVHFSGKKNCNEVLFPAESIIGMVKAPCFGAAVISRSADV